MSSNDQSAQKRGTKVLLLTVVRTTIHDIRVEVPDDIATYDLEAIAEITAEHDDEHSLLDSLYVADTELCENAEFQAYRRRGDEWHVRRIECDSRPCRCMADLHNSILRRHGCRGEVEFNRVTIEFEDGSVSPGITYYRPSDTVVLAFMEDHLLVGHLNCDHCYPVTKETRSLPWESVFCNAVVHYTDSTFPHSIDLLGRDLDEEEELGDQGHEGQARQLFLLPHWELFRPTPRKATDPNKSVHRLD